MSAIIDPEKTRICTGNRTLYKQPDLVRMGIVAYPPMMKRPGNVTGQAVSGKCRLTDNQGERDDDR